MTALAFDNVSASYGGTPVLHNVAATIRAGAVTGLVGPNGAGKTTLLRLAIRWLKPDAGAISVLDRPLAEWSAQALARAVSYLPQEADAHWPIGATELVALGRMPYRRPLAPPSREDTRIVQEMLAQCDASEFAERRMDELSAGERARVLLARALAVQAPILLADEPAAHLDPAHQLRLMELLRAEAVRGTAVVVTLHDLSLASRFCDEVIVLHEGAVAVQAEPALALDDAHLEKIFGVRAIRVDGIVVPQERSAP